MGSRDNEFHMARSDCAHPPFFPPAVPKQAAPARQVSSSFHPPGALCTVPLITRGRDISFSAGCATNHRSAARLHPSAFRGTPGCRERALGFAKTLVFVPALVFTGHKNSSKSSGLSQPQFLIWKMDVTSAQRPAQSVCKGQREKRVL